MGQSRQISEKGGEIFESHVPVRWSWLLQRTFCPRVAQQLVGTIVRRTHSSAASTTRPTIVGCGTVAEKTWPEKSSINTLRTLYFSKPNWFWYLVYWFGFSELRRVAATEQQRRYRTNVILALPTWPNIPEMMARRGEGGNAVRACAITNKTDSR